MRKIVLLGYAGMLKHQIALRTGMVPSTFGETLKRFPATGQAGALTHPEWLALMLGREMAYRSDKKLAARL
jgi:hypothetical protein